MIVNVVIPVVKDEVLCPVLSSAWKLLMMGWRPACSLRYCREAAVCTRQYLVKGVVFLPGYCDKTLYFTMFIFNIQEVML
jgi:hypothetical protein